MRAVVIGPGRIGCGFAGHLLHASGYEVVFVARKSSVADNLRRLRRYRVRLTQGNYITESIVEGFRVLYESEQELVAEQIRGADLVITSVGGCNLSSTAPLIASGLKLRNAPVNLLAFENLVNAGSCLRGLVANHLPDDFPISDYGFSGALVSRAVTQRIGDPSGDELLIFVGDTPSTFVVDASSLKQPIPIVKGMIPADNYEAWLQRKLYIYSAGHATCAYLGYLKGYNYIHSAIRDPEIRASVLEAMTEGQKGLAAWYGTEFAGDESYLLEILGRFENAALNDPIARVAGDPKRKLGAQDRLVGAARLADGAGFQPDKLMLAAAAALCFCNPSDPSAVDLQSEIESSGLKPALNKLCGLDTGNGLGHLVAGLWEQLKEGQGGDNVLLNLNELLWSRKKLNSDGTNGSNGNKSNQFSEVVEKIWKDLDGRVSRARVEEVAAQVADQYKDAKITSYLPIFIARGTRERLKAEINKGT